ncbi:hypothetical protein JCM8547_007669 [Rhodosporidiobolus lusitaniae]
MPSPGEPGGLWTEKEERSLRKVVPALQKHGQVHWDEAVEAMATRRSSSGLRDHWAKLEKKEQLAKEGDVEWSAGDDALLLNAAKKASKAKYRRMAWDDLVESLAGPHSKAAAHERLKVLQKEQKTLAKQKETAANPAQRLRRRRAWPVDSAVPPRPPCRKLEEFGKTLVELGETIKEEEEW